MNPETREGKWLYRFAILTAVTTLLLLGVGGVVTSRGAGMAVPDWPTSYGYNMFFFPFSYWMGGIFYEHSHRLIATVVGLLVVALTRWLGGRASRLPLAIIGAIEVLAGIALVQFAPDLKGAGHFLSGIGGVVLLAAAVWARDEPAQKPLPLLGWSAFFLVQIQGLLGGLRVVLFKNEIGIFHATLAQLFFLLLCVIALLTSRGWKNFQRNPISISPGLRNLITATTAIILLQLIIGATMRHQHAGLAIPDFPLAYGKIWPAMDAESVAAYNAQRVEVTAQNPITGFQIGVQMVHRLTAVMILVLVLAAAWRTIVQAGTKTALGRMAIGWAILILVQATLGAATIWSNKAADIATAHVIFGALSLALGGLITIISFLATAQMRIRQAPELNSSPDEPAFGQRPSRATGIR